MMSLMMIRWTYSTFLIAIIFQIYCLLLWHYHKTNCRLDYANDLWLLILLYVCIFELLEISLPG